MEIAVVGVSYKSTDVDLRGCVAFTSSMKSKTAKILSQAGVSEHVILSTCNRSEIYIASSNMEIDIESVKGMYQSLAGSRILSHLYVKRFDHAISHMYQVACGLDSMVVGEDEILSQLKEALAYARELGSCDKYLDKVMRESITFSKKVRNAYKISENKLSVASIGIEFLKEKYGDLTQKNILLIGTGKMGQLILRYLEEECIENIYLTNRTMNKDKISFFLDNNVKLIEYHERYEYISNMDIVISATASPHTVIKKDFYIAPDNVITFLDMAVPRDIDPDIGSEGHTEVISLDTFNQVVVQHKKFREDIAKQIENLIVEEVKEIELWLLRAKADSVIKGFHKRQTEVIRSKEDQIAKMNLNEEQAKEIREMLKSCTWKMVKQPVEQLKKLKAKTDIDNYKMIIEELFGFESGDEL